MMQSVFSNSSKLLLLSKERILPLQLVSVRYLRKPKWFSSSQPRNLQELGPIDEFQDEDYHEPSPFQAKNVNSKIKIYCKSLWLYQRELLGKDNPLYPGETINEMSELPIVPIMPRSQKLELKRIVHDDEETSIRVKSPRDKELVEEWVAIKQELEEIGKSKDNEDDIRLKAATQQMLVDMERLKSSINLADLDDAIEKAMSSEVDYNFSMDTYGNLIRGRSSNNRPDSS